MEVKVLAVWCRRPCRWGDHWVAGRVRGYVEQTGRAEASVRTQLYEGRTIRGPGTLRGRAWSTLDRIRDAPNLAGEGVQDHRLGALVLHFGDQEPASVWR